MEEILELDSCDYSYYFASMTILKPSSSENDPFLDKYWNKRGPVEAGGYYDIEIVFIQPEKVFFMSSSIRKVNWLWALY